MQSYRCPLPNCFRGIAPRAAVISWLILLAGPADFALPAAAETRDPYEILEADSLGRDVKSGYALRADTWGGDLPAGGSKRIECTLLRGNDYRFYAYSSTKGAKISFHLQDRDGVNLEAHCWQKEKGEFGFAGADIVPKSTGSYYLVVKIEHTTAERVDWSLVYAYK